VIDEMQKSLPRARPAPTTRLDVRADRRTLLPRLGVLAAILMWGTSFVATKSVLTELPPVGIVQGRAVLGAVTLALLIGLWRGRIGSPRATWPMLAVLGFVGVFFHQVIQAFGLRLTSAINTGWLIGLIPIWSALLAALLLRERFRAGKLMGLALGFAGAVLVITRGDISARSLGLPSARGDLLILASTLNWAIYTVIGHGTLRRIGPLRLALGAMVAGGLIAMPFFVARAGWRDYADLSPHGWLAMLFLGIGCSGLGYFFWSGALERIEASRVAAFLYLEPLVTLCAAAVLLGEPVTLMTVAGGALVLGGVALVQRAPGPRDPGLSPPVISPPHAGPG
jgi:drug/metabolite transporter (DMT)-like permease